MSPWPLLPQNRASAATCGHGRCKLPAILRLTPTTLQSLAAGDFFAAGEAKNPAISAAEWLRGRLRPPSILRCDSLKIFVRGPGMGGGPVVVGFRVFGAPRLSVPRSQNAYFKALWNFWTKNRGAPKTRNPTTTDLTPHSRKNRKGGTASLRSRTCV